MKKKSNEIKKEDLKVDLGIKNLTKNPNPNWTNRVLIFTPTRGLVRMEWVLTRYGQIIPTNWSFVDMRHFLSPYVPLDYQLADAQNLMAKKVIEDDYQWIIYIEDDNMVPDYLFLKFNQYINEAKVPVVSGLYFTKSNPTEPLLYRGRGTSYYRDWKIGDKVWVDGVPFGCRLESASLIKAAWELAPEYTVAGELTRRVFESPSASWYDSEKGGMVSKVGTSDLAWCTKLKEQKIFEKAGWSEFQEMEYPLLVDTTIFVKHIDQSGKVFPTSVPPEFIPEEPTARQRAIQIINGKYVE